MASRAQPDQCMWLTDVDNAKALFLGLLSLGDSMTKRPGYLEYLSSLTKLKELRCASGDIGDIEDFWISRSGVDACAQAWTESD